MKKIFKSFFLITLVAASSLFLGSCETPKSITYVQDLNEDVVLENIQRKAIRVQPEDKLSIVVHSKDPDLAALFNLPVIATNTRTMTGMNGTGSRSRSYSTSEGLSAYTVSPQGTIDFPVLGTLKIGGMTRSEVAAFIKGELIGRNLIKDPTVVVEFLNTGVSVMGEVMNPGRYDMNRDNITLLEALSLAGDLTIQGKRENVRVIREDIDGNTRVYTVDLTDGKKLLESPVYYLKQNDIIYVEPNDFRKRQTTVNGNNVLSASFWISVASLLTSVAVLIFK